ncbi:MAG: hypothetical protein CFE26_19695 [Verrucomicrobiales bacterium VVV1]|nr:MAG: hypothetical protein CFE26_19695 [Verrucomicrobiales bacterium VVV1]
MRDDPDTKDWIVLHSLDLARHVCNVAGEADFVVIVPGHGVLVIEVKSHRTVLVDGGAWHLGHDPIDSRGPFKQASQAMHSVRKYLVDQDQSFGSLVMWAAACFPRFDFRQKSPEWHDWQVINRSRMTSAPVSRIILGILAQGRALLASAGLACAHDQARHASAERCEAISKILRPRFEFAMSPKARRKELDEDLLRLTEEQFMALDQASLNRRVVFSGPAGAGKTVLAMEALRRETAPGLAKRPALFCFTKLLGGELAKNAAATVPCAAVGHIDAWLSDIAKPVITKADRESPEFFKGLLASRAIDVLLSAESEATLFDFLVLDEAQDLLQPHYLDVLDLVLEGGLAGGRWLMFGDFVGQDIFTQGKIGLESFVADRCPSAARFLLTTNCRNTKAISEYVVTLGKLDPPYRRVLRPDDRMDPELEFWKSREQQRTLVISFIERCLADGFGLADIVHLRTRADGSIGQLLGSDPQWISKVAPWGSRSDRIGYATIQGFKGLEAPVVLVTDFEAMDSSQQQSLFYIGLSRALHRLGIFLKDDLKSFVRSIT